MGWLIRWPSRGLPKVSIILPQLFWGATLENQLDCGWPLEAPVTYPVPRAPSEVVQAADASAEDGWYVGTDHILEADFRYVPAASQPAPLATGSTAPNGMDAMLAWARQRGKVRFVPDRTAPGNYVDGYVVDPWNGAPGIESLDGSQRYHLKFRSQQRSYSEALRGLMFEYAPGADISPYGLNGTSTRSSTGSFIDSGGLSANALANVLRDRHYPSGFGPGGLILPRTSLVEGAATNSLLQSQALATTWVSSALTAFNNNVAAPDGTVTATFLRPDTSSSTNHIISQSVAYTQNENVALSICVKAAGYSAIYLQATDNIANAIGYTFDLVTGTASTDVGTGTRTLNGKMIIPLAGGWWYIAIWGNVGGTATAIVPSIRVFDTIGHANSFTAYAGDGVQGVYAWGAQLERNSSNKRPPTSYFATTTVAASRSTDNLTFPWPYKPQAQWFYLKFTELGTSGIGVNAAGGWFQLGSSVDRSVFFVMELGAPTFSFYHRGLVDRSVGVNISAVVRGDTCEALGVLFGDGSVDLWFSRNGAADVHAGASAAFPGGLAAAWSNNLLGLGMWSGVVDRGVTGIQSFKVGAGSNVNSLAMARAA